MKITRTELKNMIRESVARKVLEESLKIRKQQLENELQYLNEDDMNIAAPISNTAAETKEEVEEKESVFDSKPGETVIMNFEGVTIKIQRQLDDLFKVVDATESKKLREGDYIKVQGNDTLQKGKSFKFSIFRETPLKYETNPLDSWKIIRN
jgi:FKBP-type peptidyl-prolyl cis-trans isomerase